MFVGENTAPLPSRGCCKSNIFVGRIRNAIRQASEFNALVVWRYRLYDLLSAFTTPSPCQGEGAKVSLLIAPVVSMLSGCKLIN